MKKSMKLFVTLGLAVMMFFVTGESFFAETYNWAVAKTPGYTGYVTKEITTPKYNGTMYFDFTALTGTCDYCLIRFESADNSLYYINNSNKDIRVTAVGARKSFVMTFIPPVDMTKGMVFKCTLENDANIGTTLAASGTISY